MTYPVDQDFAAFAETRRQQAPDFFAGSSAPVFVARAPGSLDIMGGGADYSGSLVAALPIAEAALVAAQRDDTVAGAVTVRSGHTGNPDHRAEVTFSASAFVNPTALLKELLNGPAEGRWAGYVAGSLALLRAEGLVPRGA